MIEASKKAEAGFAHVSSAWWFEAGEAARYERFFVRVKREQPDVEAVAEGDGLAIVDPAKGGIVAFARAYRTRLGSDSSAIYFDALFEPQDPIDPSSVDLAAPPGEEPLRRIDLPALEKALDGAAGFNIATMPRLPGETPQERAYLRELLLTAVVDDLLGPASGPEETIIGISVRDRYLVGKLAPREATVEEAIEGLQGASKPDEDEEPSDLRRLEEVGEGKTKAARRRLPGEEFPTAKGRADPDDDESEALDEAKNQSLVPSSLGLTFCIDSEVESVDLETRWGNYERDPSQDVKPEKGRVLRAWKRVPSTGTIRLALSEGPIRPVAPDQSHPEVRLQGIVRAPLPSAERLVTVFLVNDQPKPKQNQDEAWVFQPEIIVRDPLGRPVFRRRPGLENQGSDPERAALELIYRRRVEFAVGHGVSAHAEPSQDDPARATEVRTIAIPEHEVPVTEPPGSDPGDRETLRELLRSGFFDMRSLAGIERPELIAGLSSLANDYEAWISEQWARIPNEVAGFDDPASKALDRCGDALRRIREGIATLAEDDDALEAFRFANEAMALQRVRSVYAIRRRRSEAIEIDDVDLPENRTWRPFQLAFILLGLPSIARPTHDDRTKPIEAIADLLWFPTGGGKTEAYLGLAAFTMAVRRLQGGLGGLDSSRGLAVIMRYTLRLLTVQQFQRASTLICAMEVLRRQDEGRWGTSPFTVGLWVGQKVTPNDTEASHEAIEAERNGQRPTQSSPAILTSCPWCGSEIKAGRDIEVSRFGQGVGQTSIFCGDALSTCEFTRAMSEGRGLPVLVVDDEIYRRPPSLLIATVDKFALMAWRGQARTLFGHASTECRRHGLLWPDSKCTGRHRARGDLRRTQPIEVRPIRPPDLIIQDELHLISGPLGTMVGLYETAIDELCTWRLHGAAIRPKVIASTATVRKAEDQVNNLFLRRVSIFPPHGLDTEDDFFSVQRPLASNPGRRYMGICSPGSARPAVLIRVYAALLTAAQALFDQFGAPSDPWMTLIGYFNSLRELGGMRRLAEDDVQTRAYRVQMSEVSRPGLAQRSVRIVDELTSRVASRDIPAKLDALDIVFRSDWDPSEKRYESKWSRGEKRAMDVVLATNMFSVGVDVQRLGLMVVNGQPKSTAEYIQATSRIGRFFPGLVCTVLTWARPRDLSHYETFEHYHATFYKHVEARSVTPFAPRALDRGLTGTMVSLMRQPLDRFNPNRGAEQLDEAALPETEKTRSVLSLRAGRATAEPRVEALLRSMAAERFDEWAKEATRPGRGLGYEPEGGDVAGLLEKPGPRAWTHFTVPLSLREVEPGTRLAMDDTRPFDGPPWVAMPPETEEGG